MALLRPMFEISEICSSKGITEAILCPGSRSAALTLAFARNPRINCQILSDERSAAFVALGKSLMTQTPSVLVCTSGSAALNFAPAVSEAFFQEIPLLILTADRPTEWINQYDGQTIFQENIYGKHVKKSYTLPADYGHAECQWFINRILNEAIDLSKKAPFGPVHINIPIREPFYPDENEVFEFRNESKIIIQPKVKKILNTATWSELIAIWEDCTNKLIAVGQSNEDYTELLKTFVESENTVVLTDIISNNKNDNFICSHDVFLPKIEQKHLKPDLIITFGKSFISKAFKKFIRDNKPKYHWHIQDNEVLFDPLQSITHKLEVCPQYFLNELLDTLSIRKFKSQDDEDFENDFMANWFKYEEQAKKLLNRYIFKTNYSEFKIIATLLESLPTNVLLHLGNSMPVRYANILQSLLPDGTFICANRGTSGIDGILSTAVGQAYKTHKIVYCLLGDVSFFYDINAFWNNNLPKNLKIILINNGGGNIFRIIDGPSKQAELEEFFVGQKQNTAKAIAETNNISYWPINNESEFKSALNKNREELGAAIIEVFCDGKADAQDFEKFKGQLLN